MQDIGEIPMDIVNTSLEGMRRAEAAVDRSATRIARLPVSLTGEPRDIVDLSAEAVALIEARNAFSANVKAAQTGQELDRSILDLLA